MAVNYFGYSGILTTSPSIDFYISKRTKTMPKRRIETYDLTGRNGAWVQDGIYATNATITYEGWIVADTHANLRNKIKNLTELLYIQRNTGYERLVDTYDDDGYMMAVPIGAPEINYTARGTAATIKITFSAKPEVYLTVGDEWTDISAGATIDWWGNSYIGSYDTFPLLETTGDGTMTLRTDASSLYSEANYTITVTNTPSRKIIHDFEHGKVTYADTGASAASVVVWKSSQTNRIAVPYWLAGRYHYSIIAGTGISGRIKPRWYRI
jgi:phage-related protein